MCKSFGESMDLADLEQLPRGVTVVVQCLGECTRRVRVTTGSGVAGWINIKNMENAPLVKKVSIRREDEFEVGGMHEVKSTALILREAEAMDSDVLGKLEPGKILRILELGTMNKRRAKVQADCGVGWVSVLSQDSQALIGMIQQGGVSPDTMELIRAAQQNDLSKVKEKLERGGRKSVFSHTDKSGVNSVDVRGRTALMHAASSGSIDTVHYLLQCSNVDVNRIDDSRRTALHHCVRPAADVEPSLTVDCAHALLQRRAHLEARDHNGLTVLMTAAQSGIPDVISLLLQFHADVKAKNCKGQRALDIAREAGHGQDVIAKLDSSGEPRPEEDLPPYPAERPSENEAPVAEASTLGSCVSSIAELEKGPTDQNDTSRRARSKSKPKVMKKKVTKDLSKSGTLELAENAADEDTSCQGEKEMTKKRSMSKTRPSRKS